DVAEHGDAVAFGQHRAGGRGAELADDRDRQAEDGARMQRELGQVLRNQRHQAGVVRPRRDFREPDLVALDEEFHAEHAAAAERGRDLAGHLPRPLQRARRHRLRLPALAVVAVALQVADRVAEAGAAGVAHGEQGDLVVEVHEALDDHPPGAGAAAGLGVVPRRLQVVFAPDDALAVAGRGHHRLHHDRQAERRDGVAIILERGHEAVRRHRDAQFLRGQAADAFAVHGQARGTRGGDHAQALGFHFDQGRGVDRLDLGHHDVRALALDHRAHRGAVEHVDDVTAMRDLHRRRVGVTVDRDHLDAEALQLDGDFLAELARAEQEHAGRMRGQGGTDRGHRHSLCDAWAMARRPALACFLVALLAGTLASCTSPPPFVQLSGLVLDARLQEISGVAASRRHDDTLWMVNDGGSAPELHAVSRRGSRVASLRLEGVDNTDWEDLAAFELDGRSYVLVADTGDNGGLRKTLQLHVIEEPARLADATVRPAWSIAFR